MSIIIREVPLQIAWQMRQQVMYPHLSIDAVKLANDATGNHLGLFEGTELCSVVSLFRRGDALQFRKFATAKHLQGKGYGTRLLQHVFQTAGEASVTKIWCNARTTAAAFYRKFGMQPFGATWQEHGHEFIKMQIEL